MSGLRLQPPSAFNFRTPDEWPRWRKRFEQFRLASGLSDDGDAKQISTLLYCMGEDAEDTLSSTNITAEERRKYESVLGKFDEFFKVRRNVIFERAKFNRRIQQRGESVEQFITALYSLVESCNYGDLRDEMIRDRIVVGISDSSLSERLQMMADLTLEKAMTLVRQREAVHENQLTLKGQLKPEMRLESIQKQPPFKGKQKPPKNAYQAKTQHKCTRCGRSSHSRNQCPARDAECHKCHKRGHYSAQCLTKSVSEISDPPPSQDLPDYDLAYLNTIGSGKTTMWTCIVLVNGQETCFKVDTGAEVTVMSAQECANLGLGVIQQATKQLRGPDGSPLTVDGQVTAKLAYKDHECTHTIFILRSLKHNLLGLPAIRDLQILPKVDSIDQTPKMQFPSLFAGLGEFKGAPYEIKLKPDFKPFALYTPRTVALPLREKVQAELQRMQELGVISPIEEPTPWCSGMVVVPKKSGQVRICVDYRVLNESVLREVHPLPKVDETLAQMTGAAVFSKLDANCGFWQIPLDESSRKLTTFITPFGRFCFNRMPFGICSAPEYFQRRMSSILTGHKGVLCHMDDVFIFGSDQREHDERLQAALQTIKDAGVTLNADKCKFSQSSVTFLGHVIDRNGISADPSKTRAVLEMSKPTSVTELRRYLGMVNQLGKFSPKLSDLSQPLRELLSKNRSWTWGSAQEASFGEIKRELATPTVLALYDTAAPTKISADASAYGLGAVLLQQHVDHWKPVAFASRSMTDTESRYSQIEKEALALVWACDKFSDYILGKDIQLETDHKPLVPLLGKTNLDCLPPRVLRFRLRLMRFSYTISHVPGKHLYTADTLSRAPVSVPETTHELENNYTECFVNNIVSSLPASSDRLHCYRTAQQADSTCQRVASLCKEGWPNRIQQVAHDLRRFWPVRGELTMYDGLLLRGSRIVVPHKLQKETLEKIHCGHQGIRKCQQRVSMAVWWPGVNQQVEQLILNCQECSKSGTSRRQPLLPTPLPQYPWEKVASDLFEINGVTYILVVDYFSRYVEVQSLTTTTSASVIRTLKSVFARHGLPTTVVSDNGPQYSSQEFASFAREYQFEHLTSSPQYPQSNGLAERTVKTVKSLLEKSSDPCLALLAYRSTPLPWCGFSPAQLLMGRSLRSNIPQIPQSFVPEWSYLTEFREKDAEEKRKQKTNFDLRHRVSELPPLEPDQTFWVWTNNRIDPGQVLTSAHTPRSYVVGTPSGTLRRNQVHITTRPSASDFSDNCNNIRNTPSRAVTRSQTGAPVRPPARLSYWRRGDVVDS